MKVELIGRLVPHWTFEEMASPDGELKIDSLEAVEHAYMMEELRMCAVRKYPEVFPEELGLNNSSWYRSIVFNASLPNAASNSTHPDCRATDLKWIPQNLYEWFRDTWEVICSVHNKIGGCEFGTDYIHLDSFSDKFGHKTFRFVDNR